MKYKTLFRVLMKVIGVWMFASGLASVVSHLINIAATGIFDSYSNYDWRIVVANFIGYGGTQVLIGLYLFFGGKWIVNLAIPGNREYCHECGYTLSEQSGADCPECGTPTGRIQTARPTVSSPTDTIESSSSQPAPRSQHVSSDL